ncbi:MAG: S66 peptidase family protein [Candidatus Izemoplasmatales bacterium]
MPLIKPIALRPGDRVATVSSSWGGAGDPELRWRYDAGKAALEREFGLKVVEMPHTLAGSEYVYDHPEARAQDLMDAFRDPSIKAIFSCIGGDDSIRILPYVDFDVIRRNPKPFLGFSDSTITHLICHKAGVTSYYGPAILSEFGENNGVYPYTLDRVRRALFSTAPIGAVTPPAAWTGERIHWSYENRFKVKAMQPHEGVIVLQGRGVVRGRLFGGCLEVLEFAKGTRLWPSRRTFSRAILFFETSEDQPSPANVEYILRSYGVLGVLQAANALVFGKPSGNVHFEAYRKSIVKIMREFGLEDKPVLYNLCFGHNEPMAVIPYGVRAEVDADRGVLRILEAGVR